MTSRWLVRSVLVMLPFCSLLGCAADTTAPLSLDSGAAGISIKTTPNTLKGAAGVPFPAAGVPGVAFSLGGGTAGATYYWTVTGSLPPGLVVFPPDNLTPSSTLTLFGVPSSGGIFPFQITVHTAPNHVQLASESFSIEIAGDSNTPPVISDLALTWLTGVTYQQALTATGGKTPYGSWFATGLPPEITLDSKTGTLSGTPVNIGDYDVTVAVVDAAGREGRGTLSLSVKTWTLADAQGTWTGLIKTGPLADKRLSLLFNDLGIAQQGTMDTTILVTSTQGLPFSIGTDPPYAGQFNGPIAMLSWHLVCTPSSSGDLECIGHDFSPALTNGKVTLSRINANNQDLDPPTVVSGVYAAAAADGTGGPRVTVTFSELMSGTGTAGSSITVTGGSGSATVGTPTFPVTDPTTTEARTLTIPLSQLQNGTTYTLTLNPSGQRGFLDLAGNPLATKAISFTTGNLNANRSPTANALTLSATVNTPRTITLTGSDPEGLPLTSARIVSGPSRGTLSVTTWTGASPYVTSYTPTQDFIGSDSFTFTVTDSSGNVSPLATVGITIRAANTAPTATPQTVSVVHGRSIVITLTGTDPDVGDYLTAYTITRNPTSGTLTGAGALKTYTPTNATYIGPDSFDFTLTDSAGDTSAQATVIINVTNQPPTVPTQSITVPRDTTTAITLPGTDPDGDTLTYTTPTTTDQGGTLTLGIGAARTYTPQSGFSGTDTFAYTVSDGVPPAITATLTITVSTNPPPTANPQTFTFTKRIGQFLYQTQYAITLTGSPSAVGFKIVRFPAHQDPAQVLSMAAGRLYQFVDPANPLTITQQTSTTASSVDETAGPARGVITVTPSGSPFTIIYTPNTCHVDIFDQDSFDFVAIDADGLTSAPATITMNSTTNICSHLF